MESQEQQIRAYMKQLADMGYHSYQINDIIKDVIHTTRLEGLTPAQAADLLEALEDYIKFASKCKRGSNQK